MQWFPCGQSAPNTGGDGGEGILGRLANRIEVDGSVVPDRCERLTGPGYLLFTILLRPAFTQVEPGHIVRVIIGP